MYEHLPDTRKGLNHKCVLHFMRPSGEPGRMIIYLRFGFFADGRVGEIFIDINASGEESKTAEGKFADVLYYETVSGWADQWAIAISRDLQAGDSLEKIISKFSFQDFPPQGSTENPDIPMCKSIPDYTARFLQQQFGTKDK